MRYSRIVDLSQPIIHGGGFGRPAQITYSDHRSRGKALADQLGIDPKDFDHKTNNMEEFSFLTTHTGTHFDSPWHSHGIIAGSPVYFGLMAAELKNVFDKFVGVRRVISGLDVSVLRIKG